MKSKKRHHTSSEDSEESDASENSSSSGSEDSSVSEHRYKKKRKRADSSESDSDSDDQKRSKKRKHKKKKKKHSKKKKRSDAAAGSDTAYDVFSLSDGEISSKKKRKNKHKHKRGRSSSVSEIVEDHVQPRLHSVVKERRDSSEERSQPTRTYYQKEYRRSVSHEDYEREREVQRFYRGSSKERRDQYQQQYEYSREHPDRYAQYHEKYDRNREKQGQVAQYNGSNEDFNRRQKEYEYKRNQRYEDHRPPEPEYRRRPRDDDRYQPKEDPRGYNRYNPNYDDRAPKRREYDDNRDYRERRGPPDHDRVRDREYQDRKEKYHREEEFSAERARDFRRERPPVSAASRAAAPVPAPHQRNQSRSRSREDRFKERSRRPENREERYERDGPGEERRERAARGERAELPARRSVQPEPPQRERKSRFTDTEETKEYNWGKTEAKKEDGAGVGDKEKPNFGLSGKLTADANTVNGVVIKYSEPEDAKQPKRRWRFYPFKGDKALPILYIHRQSAFLIGRDKKVVDIALEHPSISKQHAALQFRATPFTRDDGSQGRRVRPYLIDLDSANGTFVNNKKIEPRRYVELLERDVVKFGFSQREYVLLHENSKDEALDDDHEPPAPPTADRVKREKRARQELAEDGE